MDFISYTQIQFKQAETIFDLFHWRQRKGKKKKEYVYLEEISPNITVTGAKVNESNSLKRDTPSDWILILGNMLCTRNKIEN